MSFWNRLFGGARENRVEISGFKLHVNKEVANFQLYLRTHFNPSGDNRALDYIHNNSQGADFFLQFFYPTHYCFLGKGNSSINRSDWHSINQHAKIFIPFGYLVCKKVASIKIPIGYFYGDNKVSAIVGYKHNHKRSSPLVNIDVEHFLASIHSYTHISVVHGILNQDFLSRLAHDVVHNKGRMNSISYHYVSKHHFDWEIINYNHKGQWHTWFKIN